MTNVVVASPAADAASLIASRLERIAERLDEAAAELQSVAPAQWQGPAAAAFVVARSTAVDRLAAAANAAHEAVAITRRAAILACDEAA